MSQIETKVEAVATGRITGAPKLSRTAEGVAVCRFVVSTEAGPASTPVKKDIYVIGDLAAKPGEDLAVRCMNLDLGDLVTVPGTERQRLRCVRGVEFTETAIEASNVRRRARAA
jgi:hypothetical protein